MAVTKASTLARLLPYLFILQLPIVLAQYSVGVYWGQNRVRRLYPYQDVYWEPSLAAICAASSPYQTVYLSWITQWYSTNAADGTNGQGFGIGLDYHCAVSGGGSGSGASAPNGANNNGQFGMVNCPDVGTGINACRANGKRVILSIQPSDSLPSASEAIARAQLLYTLFFTYNQAVSNGVVIQKPFGNVVLDGIDIFLRGSYNYVSNFVVAFRQLSGGSAKVIVSPLCSYPDSRLGPNFANTVLQNSSQSVDQINVWFTSSPSDYGSGSLFWSTLASWLRFAESNARGQTVTIGLPSTQQTSYDDAAPGDYVSPIQFQTDNIVPRLKNASYTFSGISLFEAGFDNLNRPCGNDNTFAQRTYGGFIQQQLTGSPSVTGSNTPLNGSTFCNVTSSLLSSPPGSSDTTGAGLSSGATDGAVSSGFALALVITALAVYHQWR